MKHRGLKPCSECGSNDYDSDCDGNHCKVTCADCGAFVAEVPMHTEV